MFKNYKFQEEVINNRDDKIIVCDFARRTGKTTTAIAKILDNQPKQVLWIDNEMLNYSLKKIKLLVNEVFDQNIKDVKDFNYSSVKRIRVKEFKIGNSVISLINKPSSWADIDYELSNLKSYYDMIILDDISSVDIKSNINFGQCISFITENIDNIDIDYNKKYYFCGLKRSLKNKFISGEDILDMIKVTRVFFNIEIDILNEYSSLRYLYNLPKVNYNFSEDALRMLEKEYLSIKPMSTNILTRNGLLDMMIKIKKQIGK